MTWDEARHGAARKRCEAATAGPWEWLHLRGKRKTRACELGSLTTGTWVLSEEAVTEEGDIVISGPADEVFITTARVDLPDALDEIERLRGLVRRLALEEPRDYEFNICIYCRQGDCEDETHADDCPWVEAQKEEKEETR